MDKFDEKARETAVRIIEWLEANCMVYEYQVGDKDGLAKILNQFGRDVDREAREEFDAPLREIAFHVPTVTMMSEIRVCNVDEVFKLKRIAADAREKIRAVSGYPTIREAVRAAIEREKERE